MSFVCKKESRHDSQTLISFVVVSPSQTSWHSLNTFSLHCSDPQAWQESMSLFLFKAGLDEQWYCLRAKNILEMVLKCPKLNGKILISLLISCLLLINKILPPALGEPERKGRNGSFWLQEPLSLPGLLPHPPQKQKQKKLIEALCLLYSALHFTQLRLEESGLLGISRKRINKSVVYRLGHKPIYSLITRE